MADLTRYMDPYARTRSMPLNDAVLDGVKQAADEAFPADLVSMTFKLAAPSVGVDTFTIKDKAIKLKVGSQLHYAFSKYRDGRSYKKLIKKGGAPSFTAIKAQLKKIVDDRVASDYKTGDAWKTTVDEVGKFVFTETTWLSIKPV